jgi:hypothetical protein
MVSYKGISLLRLLNCVLCASMQPCFSQQKFLSSCTTCSSLLDTFIFYRYRPTVSENSSFRSRGSRSLASASGSAHSSVASSRHPSRAPSRASLVAHRINNSSQPGIEIEESFSNEEESFSKVNGGNVLGKAVAAIELAANRSQDEESTSPFQSVGRRSGTLHTRFTED